MEKEDKFWKEGYFAESLSYEDMKEKMKTIQKKGNGDMNYNFRKCKKKISAHNKDWHAHLCDECFDKEYFKK